VKIHKNQGDLAVVTVDKASTIALNLAVALLGTPFRSTTRLSGNKLFTIPFVNNSLVCPIFPYYSSKMISPGLWRLPFFSLDQSSTI